MKYLALTLGLIASMLTSTSVANLLIGPAQAMPPCDNDPTKVCLTIPADWFKLKGCPGCPETLSILDLIKIVEHDGDIGGGGLVNISMSRGQTFDTLTIMLPKSLSSENLTTMVK